jgi:hypothetical protein
MRLILALIISVLFSQNFSAKSLHFNLPNDSAEFSAKIIEIVETVERHASFEMAGEHEPVYTDFFIARNISLEAYRYKSNHGNIEIYLNNSRQIHSTLPPPALN